MTDPNWINSRVIKAFHDRQINEHGGLPGLRDEGFYLLYHRPKTPFNILTQNQTSPNSLPPTDLDSRKIIRSMTLINAPH